MAAVVVVNVPVAAAVVADDPGPSGSVIFTIVTVSYLTILSSIKGEFLHNGIKY
jgi:hypothetical protein